ncbi:MafI family immunity protein [Streptomyces sp. NPDC053720]|uniref:MafI family immunity protein n=1 Tax=Streptomyces sp. NPDC053720 TaxID=3154855 RepID=UPI00342A5F5A
MLASAARRACAGADGQRKSHDLDQGTGNTGAMTDDRKALQASRNQTRDHLDAARAHLTRLPDIDLSATLEFLEHNELGLAFDCLVDLGDDLGPPLSFWRHLDRAAREMRFTAMRCTGPTSQLPTALSRWCGVDRLRVRQGAGVGWGAWPTLRWAGRWRR